MRNDGPAYNGAMKADFMLGAVGLLAGSGVSAAEHLLAVDQDLIGAPRVIEARYEDTFPSIARAHNVGFEALRRANPGVDPWLPGEGTTIVVPTQYVLPHAPRHGIVVNLPELRLYYFPDGESGRVVTYPVSIGRMDWRTPLGRTTIVTKTRNPSWYPPESIRAEHAAMNDPLPAIVPPGPDNPLGAHALRLAIAGGYLIHGTNKPAGVGMYVTHGCIRMFPEDVEALFSVVPIGTQVLIVNQPYKLGFGADGLYLEAHRPLPALSAGDDDEPETASSAVTELTRIYVAVTENRSAQVHWDAAEIALEAASGIPQFVSIAPVTADSGETQDIRAVETAL
jgi:L,D-transpeptidase ErfK/SrfK